MDLQGVPLSVPLESCFHPREDVRAAVPVHGPITAAIGKTITRSLLSNPDFARTASHRTASSGLL